MKTLHLTLKKYWFDMVSDPNHITRKDEEYREIKPYWVKRLLMDVEVKDPSINLEQLISLIKNGSTDVSYSFVDFDRVDFRNGYSKYSPQRICDFLGLEIGIGKPEWGAPDYPVFIIKLDLIF